MDYIRKITNIDRIAGIMNIPENMRHKTVEVIILPYEEDANENKQAGIKKNVKGLLQKYANLNYLPLENWLGWKR